MKIAYLCSDVDVELHGDQGCSVHIREFTNALVDAGHDVFIICAWLGDAPKISTKARIYYLEPAGLNKTVWGSLNDDPAILNNFLERDIGSVLWNLWLQNEGAAILEKERPDFIYERYALFGTGGLQLRKRFDIPLILELNAPLCDQQEGYQKFPLIATARQLETIILAGADAIVALTPWLSHWAVGLGADRERVHILPDAVSARLFAAESDGQAVRRTLELGERQVVGFVGSFHKWHDVAGLIDAFARIHASNGNTLLLLVGDGDDRRKLEQKVKQLGLRDAVVFTGKVPHEHIPHHIAAMDVPVVPYRPIEDFFFSPMKLFECMAVGRPTVAANLGQISEVVEHGKTGWLYTAGNCDELVKGIATLLANRPLAGQIGNAARKHVLANHTWEQVTHQVVEIACKLSSQSFPGLT